MEKLGQILIRDKVITEQELEATIRAQVIYGGTIDTNLIELGYADINQVGKALSEAHRVPTVDGAQIKPCTQEVISKLGHKMATKHKCVPLAMDKTSMDVLLIDPADLNAIDDLGFATGKRIKPHVAPELVVYALLEKYYGVARPMRFISIALAGKKEEPKQPLPMETLPPEPAVEKITAHDLGGVEEPSKIPEEPGEKEEFIDIPSPPPSELEEEAVLNLDDLIHKTEMAPVEFIEEEDEEEEELELLEDLPELLTLEEATARLANVDDRDELGRIVLSFALGYFKRAALFITRFDRVIGWYGMGGNLKADMVKSVMLPLSEPSLFKTVFDTQAFYLGAVNPSPMNDLFLKAMGNEKPASAFLIPIHYQGQVVNILYGDNGHGEPAPFEISDLLILAPKVPQAFDQLILKKKKQV